MTAYYRSNSPVVGYSGHIPGEKWRIGSRSPKSTGGASLFGSGSGASGFGIRKLEGTENNSATTFGGMVTTDGSQIYDWEGNSERRTLNFLSAEGRQLPNNVDAYPTRAPQPRVHTQLVADDHRRTLSTREIFVERSSPQSHHEDIYRNYRDRVEESYDDDDGSDNNYESREQRDGSRYMGERRHYRRRFQDEGERVIDRRPVAEDTRERLPATVGHHGEKRQDNGEDDNRMESRSRSIKRDFSADYSLTEHFDNSDPNRGKSRLTDKPSGHKPTTHHNYLAVPTLNNSKRQSRSKEPTVVKEVAAAVGGSVSQSSTKLRSKSLKSRRSNVYDRLTQKVTSRHNCFAITNSEEEEERKEAAINRRQYVSRAKISEISKKNRQNRFVGNLDDHLDEKSSGDDGKPKERIVTEDGAEERATSRASSAAIVTECDGTSSSTRSVHSRSAESGVNGTWPEDDREEEDVPAPSYAERDDFQQRRYDKCESHYRGGEQEEAVVKEEDEGQLNRGATDLTLQTISNNSDEAAGAYNISSGGSTVMSGGRRVTVEPPSGISKAADSACLRLKQRHHTNSHLNENGDSIIIEEEVSPVVRHNGDNLFDGLPRRDADEMLTQGQALRNIRAHYGGDVADARQHFDGKVTDYATAFKKQTTRADMHGERMRSSRNVFAAQKANDMERTRLNGSKASSKIVRDESIEIDESKIPAAGYGGHMPELYRLGVGKPFSVAAKESLKLQESQRRQHQAAVASLNVSSDDAVTSRHGSDAVEHRFTSRRRASREPLPYYQHQTPY